MLGFSLGLKGMAIAAVVAFAVGSFAGWATRDAFCDAASAKLEVVGLKKQLKARDVAATQDVARAEADAVTKSELEGAVRELQGKISAGQCFSADDTDSLRRLWK